MCDVRSLQFEILVTFDFCFPAVTICSVIISLGSVFPEKFSLYSTCPWTYAQFTRLHPPPPNLNLLLAMTELPGPAVLCFRNIIVWGIS